MNKHQTKTSIWSVSAIFVLIAATVIMMLPISSSTQAQETREVEIYGLFEEQFTIDAEVDNPYNPNDIDVSGSFISPNGDRIIVPGFYMEPYEQTCQDDCLAEVLEPAGEGEWRVRFSPTELGRWQYSISASIDGAANEEITSGRFTVVESDNKGFVRVADNQRYFVFDNGESFFPIGQNLGWSWDNGGGVFTYIEWLDQLQAAGANFARLNIDVPWFIGLEWNAPAGQYGDEGQQAAWRLDTILQSAEERGIYLQLSLIWHRTFQNYQGVPVVIPDEPDRPSQAIDFSSSPYNSSLAGSLDSPEGVFRDPVSRNLLERRLRYISARWGYSPNIFAWEIVDTFDQMDGFTTEGGIDWLNPLIASLREDDPHSHLITVGLREYNQAIQTQADIDFVQTRLYQNRPIESTGDQVTLTLATIAQSTAIDNKPVLLTEFSLNRWFEPTNDDPTGVHIQNTIWSSLFAGSAGAPASNWWDTYIDPQNLYDVYRPIQLFTQDIDWATSNFDILEPTVVGNNIDYQPLRLEEFNRLFRSASLADTIYYVTPDGSIPPTNLTTSYLYGRQFNEENSRPQTYVVSPPVDTELIVAVENVSTAADAQLVVTIDGQVQTTMDLTAGTDAFTLNFPLEAGTHTVILDNLGQDWLQLEYLEVSDYVAPLRALGLVDYEKGMALVWVHHREWTWDSVLADDVIEALDYRLQVPQLPAGNYRVEFWDPITGQLIGEERITAIENAPLEVDLLPIRTQLALRLFYEGEFVDSEEESMPIPATLQPTRTPVVDE